MSYRAEPGSRARIRQCQVDRKSQTYFGEIPRLVTGVSTVQPQSKPTAIHYAFVIAVLVVVVAALSWLMEYQQGVACRQRNRTLAAESEKLKSDVADCRKKADDDKALAEERVQTLVAANDAAKATLVFVEK